MGLTLIAVPVRNIADLIHFLRTRKTREPCVKLTREGYTFMFFSEDLYEQLEEKNQMNLWVNPFLMDEGIQHILLRVDTKKEDRWRDRMRRFVMEDSEERKTPLLSIREVFAETDLSDEEANALIDLPIGGAPSLDKSTLTITRVRWDE